MYLLSTFQYRTQTIRDIVLSEATLEVTLHSLSHQKLKNFPLLWSDKSFKPPVLTFNMDSIKSVRLLKQTNGLNNSADIDGLRAMKTRRWFRMRKYS